MMAQNSALIIAIRFSGMLALFILTKIRRKIIDHDIEVSFVVVNLLQSKSKIMERRLEPLSKKMDGCEKSTIDEIFSVEQTLDTCKEYNVDVHTIFVDFKRRAQDDRSIVTA